MKFFRYQVLFFLLMHIKYGYNFPTGAPNMACTTMMPNHDGLASRSCSLKYIIRSDKSEYFSNETVRITVNGSTSADTFRGVLLIAKTQSDAQIIGTWTAVDTTTRTVDCNNAPGTGITHNNRTDKLSVAALWQPPLSISNANITIRATVVTAYNEFYVNCFSVALTIKQSNQSTNGTISTTANPITVTSSTSSSTTTTVVPTSDVGVNVNWAYASGVTTVTMQINNLKTSQWAALGLSLDQSMGEDHVFICKHLADNTVAVERRINPSGRAPPVLVDTATNPGGTFQATSQKLEDGVAVCAFTLSNFASTGRRRRAISSLSQSTSYYPLIAIGNLDSSNGIMKHTSRTALDKNVQLNRQETIAYNADESDSNRQGLMKAHGIIMIFTWILFVSTGVLIARYFKTSWPGKKVCGKPIWFSAHRALMTSVAILTIIAFILILVYEKGKWVPREEKVVFAHSIVGILVICFAIIQPIMALFRCKPEAKYRFIFNYLHRTIGITALILSIVAIFLAMFFTDFDFADRKIWGIVVAWACWLPIIFLVFWFVEFHFTKQALDNEKTDSYDMYTTNGNDPMQNNPPKMVDNTTRDRLKTLLLFIHILVALGLALALAIIVGAA